MSSFIPRRDIDATPLIRITLDLAAWDGDFDLMEACATLLADRGANDQPQPEESAVMAAMARFCP